MDNSISNSPNSLFAQPRVSVKSGTNGEIYLSCPYELPKPARCIGDWLEKWAIKTPDKIFLADKNLAHNSWTKITYSQTLKRVLEIAGWLLETNAGSDRPITILSENSLSIMHCLPLPGCMWEFRLQQFPPPIHFSHPTI